MGKTLMDPSATSSQSTTDSAFPPNLFVILCEGLVLSKGGVQPSFWSQECVWIYVNFFCFYVILFKKKLIWLLFIHLSKC